MMDRSKYPLHSFDLQENNKDVKSYNVNYLLHLQKWVQPNKH